MAGLADCVDVFRSLAQGQYGRFGQAAGLNTISGERAHLMPYGVLAPPQRFAMRVRRYMHKHGVHQDAWRAIALASDHAPRPLRSQRVTGYLPKPMRDALPHATLAFGLIDDL